MIVGLGNIGEKYEFTRHNVGFMFVDNIAKYYSTTFKKSDNSLVSSFKIEDTKVVLIKPTTYMNSSGIAVKYWTDWLKINSDDVLVISDDLHLDIGDVKFRISGGTGGHNGLKSIEENIGNSYCRLRIGIGNNYEYGHQADFVLGKFTKEELDKILLNNEFVLSLVDTFIKNSDKELRIKKINNLISVRE